MNSSEFPLILSPNLGCPRIISLEEVNEGKTISLIVAWRYGEFTSPLRKALEGALYLRPSCRGDKKVQDIPLHLTSNPEEIKDWNLLSGFSEMDDTRNILNSELHYEVLGENTRYWKVEVSAHAKGTPDNVRLLGENGEAKLYDLVLKDTSEKWERVNYHSVHFVKSVKGECHFVHLTDLHTAKRNDEILDEVLKVKNKRGRKEIEGTFINFNDKLREFISIANKMADEGKLDFVMITGDMVDFAFHGWEDESNPDENNWRTFINIITGVGKEKLKDNPGIKVPVFTSTGNHDWRLHPYNPNLLTKNKSFGLEKDELKNYKYKSFDSTEFPGSERAKRSIKLTKLAIKWLDKGGLGLAKIILSKFPLIGTVIALILGVSGTGAKEFLSYFPNTDVYKLWLPLGIILVVGFLYKIFFKRWLRKYLDYIVDNPLHAKGKALHYYFKHINPYLDYAFRYGDHSFVVMDTGADIFDGQVQDNKNTKDLLHLSIEDNILGGSPDSRAFDAKQAYCNWSQIVWLEKVLLGKDGRKDGLKNLFIFVHAPPLNPGENVKWESLYESRRLSEGKSRWIPKEDTDLTQGTINHYLSQFLYLCMGYRESALTDRWDNYNLNKATLVFSGHAHRNIEFRIDKGPDHNIRIYSGVYSHQLSISTTPEKWWNENGPIILQTGACGPEGKIDRDTPYYRKVSINSQGHVTDFQVRHSD